MIYRNDRHIDFKNEFENMKLQKKGNIKYYYCIVVSKGFFSSHKTIIIRNRRIYK